MELFEKRFKQYLKEGSYWGYNDPEDEEAFLGYGANNHYVYEHFPEIREYFEDMESELDRKNPGSVSDFQSFANISSIRHFLGDDIADKFKDFAIKLTEINQDIIDIIGSYTNVDMSGAESYAYAEDVDEDLKQEALEEISSIFAETPPEDLKYDDIRLSLNNNYTGDQFEPYILVGFTDNESGDSFEVVSDATEDDYRGVFDEKVREVKDVVENTLSTSFN